MRITCFLLALVVVVGCASTPKTGATDAERELTLARGALLAGHTDLAVLRLEKAREAYRGPDPEYVTLLMAEARLQEGLPADALVLANEVLVQDGANAAANEVAGKALLRLGRFPEAQDRFMAAQGGYDADTTEYRRLDDYVLFTRGLEAYASADPQVAYQYWGTIEDPQLRFALDQAVREESNR